MVSNINYKHWTLTQTYNPSESMCFKTYNKPNQVYTIDYTTLLIIYDNFFCLFLSFGVLHSRFLCTVCNMYGTLSNSSFAMHLFFVFLGSRKNVYSMVVIQISHASWLLHQVLFNHLFLFFAFSVIYTNLNIYFSFSSSTSIWNYVPFFMHARIYASHKTFTFTSCTSTQTHTIFYIYLLTLIKWRKYMISSLCAVCCFIFLAI